MPFPSTLTAAGDGGAAAGKAREGQPQQPSPREEPEHRCWPVLLLEHVPPPGEGCEQP